MKVLLNRPTANDAQRVADKFSVRELIEFERFSRDNAQWDAMKTCYAPGSHVTVSWFEGSGEAFVEASRHMKTYAPHKLYNTLVWLNGDKAVALTLATIHIRTTIGGLPAELHSDLKMLFRTQKVAGTWCITSLNGIYEKDALLPVSPTNEMVVPTDEIATYRPSYANLTYVLRKDGQTINPNLPGIDRPELVNELYQQAEDWLLG